MFIRLQFGRDFQCWLSARCPFLAPHWFCFYRKLSARIFLRPSSKAKNSEGTNISGRCLATIRHTSMDINTITPVNDNYLIFNNNSIKKHEGGFVFFRSNNITGGSVWRFLYEKKSEHIIFPFSYINFYFYRLRLRICKP